MSADDTCIRKHHPEIKPSASPIVVLLEEIGIDVNLYSGDRHERRLVEPYTFSDVEELENAIQACIYLKPNEFIFDSGLPPQLREKIPARSVILSERLRKRLKEHDLEGLSYLERVKGDAG